MTEEQNEALMGKNNWTLERHDVSRGTTYLADGNLLIY